MFSEAIKWTHERSPEEVRQAREAVMHGIEKAAANFRSRGDVDKWSGLSLSASFLLLGRG